MSNKPLLSITLAMIFVAVLAGTINIQTAKAGTITVPDNYATIQEAINHASNGDTVFVRNGTYYENVVVNKTILLIGENREATIVDARSTGNAIQLTVDGILVSNFTISYGEVGILIVSSHKEVIRNNIIRKNTNGATGDYYTDTIYESNIVKENTYGLCFGQLNGPSSINNTAKWNEIYDNFAGFYVSATNGNNTILENIIHDNNIGIVLDHTKDNNVIGNVIRNNMRAGGYMYGIYMRNAIQNTVKQNLFMTNGVDIHFESSNNNKIFHNNFISSYTHVDGSSTNVWDDGYPSGGNYWDTYFGTDGNSDKIGDTPYVIDADNTDRYPLMQENYDYIPEFPSYLVMPLFMIMTLLAVIVYKKNHAELSYTP